MKPGPKSVHASDDRPTQARRRAGPVLAGVLLVASCAHQPALAALSDLTSTCVACHAAYRLK